MNMNINSKLLLVLLFLFAAILLGMWFALVVMGMAQPSGFITAAEVALAGIGTISGVTHASNRTVAQIASAAFPKSPLTPTAVAPTQEPPK